MDGDGDLVLVAQLVETVESILRRVGREVLESQRFAQLERFLVGVVILCERQHSVTGRCHVVIFAGFQYRLNLLRRAVERKVLRIKLAVVQAKLLDALQALFQVKFAKRVALHADGERAETLILLVLGGKQRGRGEQPTRGGRAAAQKMTASNWLH